MKTIWISLLQFLVKYQSSKSLSHILTNSIDGLHSWLLEAFWHKLLTRVFWRFINIAVGNFIRVEYQNVIRHLMKLITVLVQRRRQRLSANFHVKFSTKLKCWTNIHLKLHNSKITSISIHFDPFELINQNNQRSSKSLIESPWLFLTRIVEILLGNLE